MGLTWSARLGVERPKRIECQILHTTTDVVAHVRPQRVQTRIQGDLSAYVSLPLTKSVYTVTILA